MQGGIAYPSTSLYPVTVMQDPLQNPTCLHHGPGGALVSLGLDRVSLVGEGFRRSETGARGQTSCSSDIFKTPLQPLSLGPESWRCWVMG